MNKTRIEWTNYTWNPVTGCARSCWYCYVKRIKNYNLIPQFHLDRLIEPTEIKKPAKIFVCSTADIFGEWVIDIWIKQTLDIIKQCPQHTFQLLTKCPERIAELIESLQQPNIWLGVTVEHIRFLSRLKTLQFIARQYGLSRIFVSFEPLLSGMDLEAQEFRELNWMIIGAYTGKDAQLVRPKHHWIKDLIAKADKFKIPIFMKNNLKPAWPGELRQEFPEE